MQIVTPTLSEDCVAVVGIQVRDKCAVEARGDEPVLERVDPEEEGRF
jgi:hypothetical protein